MDKQPTNIQVVQVTSEVPIPVRIEYPLDKMEVGESFTFPEERRNTMQSRVSILKKRNGKHFTIKKVEDNQCRLWRVK